MVIKDSKKINPIISDKEAKNIKVHLQTKDGKDFGEVSASAYSAIRGNYLDKYSPVDDNEKNVLNDYKKYTSQLSPGDAKKAEPEKKDSFGKWLGKQIGAGMASFNKGLFSTIDFILPTEFLGRYDYISKVNEYYSDSYDRYTSEAQKSSASKGKGWDVAGDIVSGTVAALPNAILAFMTSGTSLAGNSAGAASTAAANAQNIKSTAKTAGLIGQTVKTMMKNPMYWTSAMQTLGLDYEDAKKRGASDLAASASAIITTALNAGIEIGGGIENLPKKLKGKGKNAVIDWAKSMVDEGKEEVLQDITTNAMAKLMYDKNAPVFSLDDDNAIINPIKNAKEFGMGAAVGGILGLGQLGTSAALNTSNIVKTGKYFNKPGVAEVIIDNGLKKPKNTNAYKIAEKASKNNGRISNYDLGRLYYENFGQNILNNENTINNNSLSNISNTETLKENAANNNFDSVKNAENSSILRSDTDAENETINVLNNNTANKAVLETVNAAANVNVGDAFKDTKTGNIITVVGRDAENTTVEIDTGAKTETREFTNSQADTLVTNKQFEQVGNSETLSPEDAQIYNIIVSNLKKKAEELGLLDNNFFTALQNVNLYNPSASDRALISTEFRRVFAGNTDPLITGWLDSISVEAQSVTSINEQNMQDTNKNTSINDTVRNIYGDKKIRVSEPAEIYNDVFYGIDGSEIRLTENEKNAIIKYKSSESYKLNGQLRSEKALSEDNLALVSNLNSALDKFPSYKGTVYRNIGFYDKYEFERFIKENSNKIVSFKEFISSSKTQEGYLIDDDVPYKAHYIINSINGKDVSNIGIIEEQEVLFKVGASFAIIDFRLDGNTINIKCEEIDENGEIHTRIHQKHHNDTRGEGKMATVSESTDITGRDETRTTAMDRVRGRENPDADVAGAESQSEPEPDRGSDVRDSGELRKQNRNKSRTQGVFQRVLEVDSNSGEDKIYIKGTERIENGSTTNNDGKNSERIGRIISEQETNGQEQKTALQAGVRERSSTDAGVFEEQSAGNNRGVGQNGISDNRASNGRNRNDTVSERKVVSGDITDSDMILAKGEILSLKHTKNPYSVFKNSNRMIKGIDMITDGFVGFPYSEEAITEIKKVYKGNIEDSKSEYFSLKKLVRNDNDIIIQGNPKVVVEKNSQPAYAFIIGDEVYMCQQKYIDAFNNNGNIIKANRKITVPWTVHDEDGNLIAIFMPMRSGKVAEYNKYKSVNELLVEAKQRKEELAKRAFNQTELRNIIKDGQVSKFEMGGKQFITNGRLFVATDENGIELVSDAYKEYHSNSSDNEVLANDSFAGRLSEVLKSKRVLAEQIKFDGTTDYSGSYSKEKASVVIIDGKAFAFPKKYTDIISRRSKSLAVVDTNAIGGALLVGYDADGNIMGATTPVLLKGDYTAKSGDAVSYINYADVKSVPEVTTPKISIDTKVQGDTADVTHKEQPVKKKEAVHSRKETKASRDMDSAVNHENRWNTKKVETSEKSNSAPENIADIVKKISDKFEIPISTGKVTVKNASGIYKERSEAIRTRITNNLPTISHELGHHLDKKYDLSKLESVKELRKAVSEEFLEQYPTNEKNSEAVAEFVRIYLKNTNDANRLCPDFYSDFVSALSKADLRALNEIASSVNEYLSYNISERYGASIVSSQKKEKLPFRDKWHKWYSDWVDAFHPQKEAVDYVEDVTGQTLSGKNNAYILATNSLNAHAVTNFLICNGFRDLDGNIVNAKSFIDSIGMVDAKNVKLLDKYLVLRHSLEWIAPQQEDVTAKRVFADDTLENVEGIKEQLAKIEKEHPEIKIAAENLYEYQNNVLKYFVIPAGGMTEDMLDTLNRKYPFYVPFYRAAGKKSGFAKGTFANQHSPIMRAKGSGALIISPTESIIKNTEKMVKFALRNQVMSIWADYADTVDGFGKFMEKVTPDMVPHFTDITAQKKRFTDVLQQTVSSGEDYFAVSDLFDEIFGDMVTDFTPVANAKKKIITVLKNGRPSYYQIHDDAFYNSVAELSPQQTSGLLRIMNTIMQPMKLLITQNNPIFAATNALRDFGTAYKLSETNNPLIFAAQYAKALGEIISGSESYKQYKAMGGGHSSELSANIENISKTLRKVAQKDTGKARRLAYSVFRHPVETVASINDAVESIPRFAEFQRTLKSGGDLQEAIFNASDITTNFRRSGKGDTAKAVNKIIMFNNAAIQGLDKAFRTITAKDPKKRYKTLLKWLLHALLMGTIGYIYNEEVDKEGYKNLSSYKKNNFYNYAIGDGKFISIPKPRENALLDTLTERTIEYLFGDNKEAFYDFGSYLASQLLPPMIPDTLDPVNAVHSVLGGTAFGGLIDIGFNQDFKGTPIEGKYEDNVPSNERYTENTTKFAYELGQTKLARDLDMSPKKIDHLISSYTGILGQINSALFPINSERKDTSIGLRNKFISDSNYSTDVLNKMYENEEKAKRAFEYTGTIDNAVEYEQNAIITSYISEMNKSIKSLPDDEQRDGRKYLLRTLNNWDYDYTDSQSEMLSRLYDKTVTDDYIITSIPKSTLEWTKNKTKYSYQMTPQEYNEYIKDYLNLVEKYRIFQGDNISSVEDYTSALEETNTEVKKVLSKKYQQKYIKKAQKVPKE